MKLSVRKYILCNSQLHFVFNCLSNFIENRHFSVALSVKVTINKSKSCIHLKYNSLLGRVNMKGFTWVYHWTNGLGRCFLNDYET